TTGNGNNNNFVITGNNTYTGGTTIAVNTCNSGAIQIGSDSAFGTGKVTNNLVSGANSPQFQALNGTRTLANAFDLNGGLTFVGTNGFVFTGPITMIQPGTNGSRTFNNTITGPGTSVTFGSAGSPSTMTLGGDSNGKT